MHTQSLYTLSNSRSDNALLLRYHHVWFPRFLHVCLLTTRSTDNPLAREWVVLEAVERDGGLALLADRVSDVQCRLVVVASEAEAESDDRLAAKLDTAKV